MSNPHQTAIIRKAILANLNAKGKDLDREISAALENGQALRITDEFGDPLGTIVKTNPSMDPVIDSPAEAFGYISGLNPDYIDHKLPDPAKSPEKYFDAVDALLEAGRGDLLTPTIEADSQKIVLTPSRSTTGRRGSSPRAGSSRRPRRAPSGSPRPRRPRHAPRSSSPPTRPSGP